MLSVVMGLHCSAVSRELSEGGEISTWYAVEEGWSWGLGIEWDLGELGLIPCSTTDFFFGVTSGKSLNFSMVPFSLCKMGMTSFHPPVLCLVYSDPEFFGQSRSLTMCLCGPQHRGAPVSVGTPTCYYNSMKNKCCSLSSRWTNRCSPGSQC